MVSNRKYLLNKKLNSGTIFVGGGKISFLCEANKIIITIFDFSKNKIANANYNVKITQKNATLKVALNY